MEICSRFTGMERKNGAFLLHTDNADVKVCFVTDEIVRVRANTNLSGRGPSILLRKTVLSLKSPTGAFIAPLRCANANLSGRAPPFCCARPFCRLKAPLGLSLLCCASQTRTFENTSLSATCKKRQGKLWQKERGLDGASPLDKEKHKALYYNKAIRT